MSRLYRFHESSNVRTASDAIAAPGVAMDWTPDRHSLSMAVASDDAAALTPAHCRIGGEPLDSHRVLRRSDTGDVLGVVSSEYRPLSNGQLAAAIDAALPTSGRVVACGEWRGGKSAFWHVMLDKFDTARDAGKGGEDVTRTGFIVSTTHDGSGSVRVGGYSERLFCTNQLNGLRKASTSLNVQHRGTVDNLSSRLSAAFRGTVEWAAGLRSTMAQLAAEPVDAAWLRGYFAEVVHAASTPAARRRVAAVGGDASAVERLNVGAAERRATSKAVGQWLDGMETLHHNFGNADNGAMPDGLRFSKFAALQAATRWVNHDRGLNYESVTAGDGAALSAKALELATA